MIEACEQAYSEVVKLLLSHPDILVSSQTNGRCALSVLHLFAEGTFKFNEQILGLLLAHSTANINNRYDLRVADDKIHLEKYVRDTPLQLAAYHGCQDFVKMFLSKPNIDINAPIKNDETRRSMLHCYASGIFDFEYSNISRVINHPTVDVNSVTRDGKTALMTAIEHGNFEMINLFISCKDIDLNTRSDEHGGILNMINATPMDRKYEILNKLFRDDRISALNLANDGPKVLKTLLEIKRNQLSKNKILDEHITNLEKFIEEAVIKRRISIVDCLKYARKPTLPIELLKLIANFAC